MLAVQEGIHCGSEAGFNTTRFASATEPQWHYNYSTYENKALWQLVGQVNLSWHLFVMQEPKFFKGCAKLMKAAHDSFQPFLSKPVI